MVATSANLRSYLVQSELSLVLHGRPEAQRRPCMQRRGNVYNPQGKQLVDTRTMIADILMCIGAIDESQKTVFDQDAKLKVQLTFFLPRPRSHLKKNAAGTWILPVAMRNSFHNLVTKKKVDLDNLSKFVLDAMNNVVYIDDTQVHILICSKVYDCESECNGRVIVTVQKINDETHLLQFAEAP